MDNIQSVKLLGDHTTVQHFQPQYGTIFAPDDDNLAPIMGAIPVPWGKAPAAVGPAIGIPAPKQTKKRIKNDTVYAKDLNIKHGSDERRCWKWKRIGVFEVAELELLNFVQDLEVSGKYEMEKLVPGSRYDIDFIIKMEKGLYFDSRVEFKATFCYKGEDDLDTVKNVDLMGVKNMANQIVHVTVGNFKSSDTGVIKFSLTNHSCQYKWGLTVVGINISLST